jgi:hypothetical protein
MPSPRNAPRREAVRVVKIGGYGHVTWMHELSCGHTITRKRKSPSGVVGCIKCLDASDFEELSQTLVVPEETPYDDGLPSAEAEAMKCKALLAGRFKVPIEQIDVVIRAAPDGMMRIDSANIFLTGRQLRALQ